MSKKLSAIGIFIALAITISGFACANATALEKVEKDAGFISVSKSTTKELSPNQAELTVKIETSDTNLKSAVSKNKTIANNVYSSLKKMICTEKGDFIKTGNYSASPNYNYKDGKKTFDKYVVANTIKVKITNVENVSKIIDTAISQGATTVDDIQFFATDYEASCNQVLSDLTKKAYSQADLIAKAAGSKVSGIKSISTSCSPENNQRPVYRMMAAMNDMASGATSTPIESGKIKVFANVDATFYVTP